MAFIGVPGGGGRRRIYQHRWNIRSGVRLILPVMSRLPLDASLNTWRAGQLRRGISSWLRPSYVAPRVESFCLGGYGRRRRRHVGRVRACAPYLLAGQLEVCRHYSCAIELHFWQTAPRDDAQASESRTGIGGWVPVRNHRVRWIRGSHHGPVMNSLVQSCGHSRTGTGQH